MKIITLLFFILTNFSSLIAQDTSICNIVFERKELPPNFYLAQLRDSTSLSNAFKFALSEKHSYGFQFALFYLTVNRRGNVTNLRLSKDQSLSKIDRIFLKSISAKLKNSQWSPAYFNLKRKIRYTSSAMTFAFSIQKEKGYIEIQINDETYDRVLFHKIYSMN